MPFESTGGAARRQVSIAKSVPAPVGGLNARDSLAAMPVTDAVRMLNFQPLPYAVAIRRGWEIWGIMPGLFPVQSIFNHSVSNASNGQHVILCSPFSTYLQVYEFDTPVLQVADFGGYAIGTMLSTEGGDFTYLVNGIQKPQVYQAAPGGSPGSFVTVNQVAAPALGFDVSGVDPTKFATVTWHQDRLWFAERDSLRAWYLPSGQVGGDAKQYNFGAFFTMGGFIQAIISWTVDAGEGMDDYLCIYSSMGEMLVYTGKNPDSIETFSKKGLFYMGAPVGRRCWCRYGGDIILITQDGLLTLSKALQSTRVNNSLALTDKIQQTISELISISGDIPGWQVLLFPKGNQLWLSAPTFDGSGVRQFSMNIITGAWCEYDSLDPVCMVLWRDQPLFGRSDGLIGLGWVGFRDRVDYDNNGNDIVAEVLTAYNYFEDTSHNKRWALCRPLLQSGDIPSSSVGLSVDFGVVEGQTVILPPPATSTPLWDSGIWDADYWPSNPKRYRAWVTIQGLGYCAALDLRVRQNTELIWTATEFVYEPGAVV